MRRHIQRRGEDEDEGNPRATEVAFEVPVGAGKLAAWRWGQGPSPVLLVHGWAGRGRQLGAAATTLALSRPGTPPAVDRLVYVSSSVDRPASPTTSAR